MNENHIETLKKYMSKDIARHKAKYGNNIGVADIRKILNDPANQTNPAYFLFRGIIQDSALNDENLAQLAAALNQL